MLLHWEVVTKIWNVKLYILTCVFLLFINAKLISNKYHWIGRISYFVILLNFFTCSSDFCYQLVSYKYFCDNDVLTHLIVQFPSIYYFVIFILLIYPDISIFIILTNWTRSILSTFTNQNLTPNITLHFKFKYCKCFLAN